MRRQQHPDSCGRTRRWFTLFKDKCSFAGATAPRGPGRPHYRALHDLSLSYTHTHTLGNTPLDEWSARRRDLYLKTRNTRSPGGIRTHNPRNRAAPDPHLRPRGDWDRPFKTHVCFLQNVTPHTHTYIYIQGVTGGTDQTSGGCSLCYTIPI